MTLSIPWRVRKLHFAGLVAVVLGCFMAGYVCPAISSGGGQTDEESSCLERWRKRSLPPTLEAAVPPDIGRQPQLRAIGIWDGGVVAFAGETAYRPDVESKRLIPIDLPNCPSVLDLGENARALYALCSRQEDLYVMTRARGQGQAWEVTLDIPEEGRVLVGDYKSGAWARLAVSESAAAVVGAESLWWRSEEDPKWRRSELTFRDPPGMAGTQLPPTVALLASGSLFLGWDFGEYGEWLYGLEIDPGGAPTGEPALIRKLPVHSIVKGQGGAVWVGAGATDWVTATGQVLLVEKPSVRAILDESNKQCDSGNGEVSLPQPAAIEGLTLDVEGRPLIVAGDLGVFRIVDDELVPLIQKRMILRYDNNGVNTGSHPVGIAATDRGIFVASRSLGVFAFLEEDSGYKFSQIVLR